MRIARLDLVHLTMPMVVPFASAHSYRNERRLFLVRITTSDGAIGWGECAAEEHAGYSNETVGIAAQKLRDDIAPRLVRVTSADEASSVMRGVAGAHFARASIYQAFLDAELRASQVSLADHLGVVTKAVRPGVVIGLQPNLADTFALLRGYVNDGYARIKFKIEPGRDHKVVSAIRECVGPDIALQVDANGSYGRDDFDLLASLDEFRLEMIEQPLNADDLDGSALLGSKMMTPICLDEGILDEESAAHALDCGAGRIINVKPGRVGGIDEAVRIIALCNARGVGCWIGGMLETGVGRTANIVLAALKGCTHPGDVSPSARYFATDLTEPFVMNSGVIDVPTEPGASRAPIDDVLRHYDATFERLI